MNDNEINIAIAEACGIHVIKACNHLGVPFGMHAYKPPHGYQPIQSYTTDLNAMHEAEKVLPENIRNYEYLQTLATLCETGRHPIHATARQRAEAFLRTIGKWKD